MKYYAVLSLMALTALTPAFPALAADEPPSFVLPVDCTLGQDCWIVNYPDVDPAPEQAQDFSCGPRSYDAHHGTDFGLPDLVAMEMSTDVLAAADGKVLRLRDDVEDKIPTKEEQTQMLAQSRGCGNGVYIDHGKGWQTIYCHLKRGSITVKAGQKVKAGTKIAAIGSSGVAEFPHMHFGVFFEGESVDPFSGIDASKDCTAAKQPLWKNMPELNYDPAIIYATGFKAGAPDISALKIDTHSPATLPAASKALTFWAGFFGVNKGDTIEMSIIGPDGKPFTRRNITQDKTRARQFYYVGKRAAKGLPPGEYTGHVQLVRQENGDQIVREHSARLSVE